jgi:hypothetical protein
MSKHDILKKFPSMSFLKNFDRISRVTIHLFPNMLKYSSKTPKQKNENKGRTN